MTGFVAAAVQMRSGISVGGQCRSGRSADPRGGGGGRQLCADAGDDQHPRPRAASACWRRSSPEESDPALARFRALAEGTRHPPAYRLDGDQARPSERRRQPRLPDRARRRHPRPLRQDPHVRRRPCRRRELSRIAPLPAGQRGGRRRPAVDAARAHHLLRRALSRISTGRWPRRAPRCWRCRPPSPARPARRTGTCCSAPGRSRPARGSIAAAQGGSHEDGRETYGHSMIVDPWGRIVAEAGARARHHPGRDRPGGERRGADRDSGACQRARLRAAGASRRPQLEPATS